MDLQISDFDAGYEGGEETWLRDMGANISLKILQLVRFYLFTYQVFFQL